MRRLTFALVNQTAFAPSSAMIKPTKPLPFAEFVVMLAFMMSIVAMSTDIMLPALALIADDLRVADPNDIQLVVSSLFLGFALGQLIVGPLSDAFGRKPIIFFFC